jgi:hypothetical protein
MTGNIIKLPTLKTDNKSVGERSEVIIMARLYEMGYQVFMPLGENQRYDLIIEDDDEHLYRIQCKTGRLSCGSIAFNTASTYFHHNKGSRRDYRGQIDYFAVYSPDIKKVYLVPVDHVGITEGRLRLEPPKNNQEKHVRWAKDYEV